MAGSPRPLEEDSLWRNVDIFPSALSRPERKPGRIEVRSSGPRLAVGGGGMDQRPPPHHTAPNSLKPLIEGNASAAGVVLRCPLLLQAHWLAGGGPG